MVYEKEIEEGDLFVFPASLLHRSPENLTNDLKSIIDARAAFMTIHDASSHGAS